MQLYDDESLSTLIAAAGAGMLPVLFVGGIFFACGASWACLFGMSAAVWSFAFVSVIRTIK